MYKRQDINSDVFAAIGGVASFLFGIIAAFTISDRHGRIENILKNGSLERSQLVVLLEVAKVFPRTFQSKLSARIDNYLMSEMDYPRRDFDRTNAPFSEIMGAVIDLKPEGDREAVAYSRLLSDVSSIEQSRKHTETLFGDTMSLREWVVLYFLSAVVLMSLVLIEPGSLVVLVIIGGLAVTMFYVLSIIHDFDSLDWRVEDKIIEPFQKTFEELGFDRYYSHGMISDHRITGYKNISQYRVGILTDYDDTSTRQIQLQKNS